jgi:hypothetical protein
MLGFKGGCAHFIFNKCPIYTHDSASGKFSTNSQETDYSVLAVRFCPSFSVGEGRSEVAMRDPVYAHHMTA